MHKNRELYSLPEYQTRLKNNAQTFNLLLQNTETGKDFFIKPKPRSLWVEEFQKDYLKPRMIKMRKSLMTLKYDMVTLTYWTKYKTAEQVAADHKKDINYFFKILRKFYGPVKYCYIVEVTLNMYPHFHIFIEKRIDKRIVRRIWRAITGAWIIHKRPVDNAKQAVIYVNEYVNKVADGNEEKFEFMYNNIDRFFGSSVGFFEKNNDADKKEIYRLISHLYSGCDFTGILKDKELEGSLLTADKFSVLMIEQKKGFRFVYDDRGRTFCEMFTFASDEDMFNFWTDFTINQGLSYSKVLDDHHPVYFSERNKK